MINAGGSRRLFCCACKPARRLQRDLARPELQHAPCMSCERKADSLPVGPSPLPPLLPPRLPLRCSQGCPGPAAPAVALEPPCKLPCRLALLVTGKG